MLFAGVLCFEFSPDCDFHPPLSLSVVLFSLPWMWWVCVCVTGCGGSVFGWFRVAGFVFMLWALWLVWGGVAGFLVLFPREEPMILSLWGRSIKKKKKTPNRHPYSIKNYKYTKSLFLNTLRCNHQSTKTKTKTK